MIVFLVGPTAVGKTTLTLKLAPKINAEIISCDSMQIYKGIDVASSKPSFNERKIARHHLIDLISPHQEYSVADYRIEAVKIIEGLLKEGKVPLVSGGSGLYFKALIDGIFEGPAKNSSLRRQLYKEAELKGAEVLYDKLKAVDSETAAKLHPNDLRRIVRALEVYHASGFPISLLKKKTTGLGSVYDTIVFGLNRSRPELYRCIDRRVDEMFERGIVEEVKKVGIAETTPAFRQLLGYKEVAEYLEGKATLEEARDNLKRNTRRFAKRQLTWFRADKRIQWINLDENTDTDILADELVQEINTKLETLNPKQAKIM